MKKSLLKGAVLCMMLMVGGSASAQSIGSILSGVLGSKSKNSSSSSSSSTTSSILSALTTVFSSSNVATKDKIVGIWVYTEPAVVFESDNVLSSLGGKVASSTIEKKLKTQLEKYGFKKGKVKMTFDKDGNFTQTLLGKTLKGTYTLEDKNVVLKYSGQVSQVVGTTQISGNDLLIVMDASKLLKYVNVIGKVSGSSTLKTATSLLSNMDGMECGLKLEKQ